MQARSLLFTVFGDFILRYGTEVWIGTLIQALARFGQTPQTVRVAVSRITREGFLRSRRVGNRSYYALTEKGRRRLEEGTRRLYRHAEDNWDRMWRVLVLEPPESRDARERLRALLTWSGFAPLAPNTWVSPRPPDESLLAAIREQQGEQQSGEGRLHLFTGSYDRADIDLVARCWDLGRVAEQYDRFIESVTARFRPVREALLAGTLDDGECFAGRVWLVHEYRKFLHLDPLLPPELVPENWAGERARTLFWEYYRLLSSGAERFFLSILQVPPAGQPAEATGRAEAAERDGAARPRRRRRRTASPLGW